MGDYRLVRQFFDNDILHTADRLSAHTDIHVDNLLLEDGLEPVDDVGEALAGLVDVIYYTFPNA